MKRFPFRANKVPHDVRGIFRVGICAIFIGQDETGVCRLNLHEEGRNKIQRKKRMVQKTPFTVGRVTGIAKPITVGHHKATS